MPRKRTKKQKLDLKSNIPTVLITVGIFFMSLSILHWYFKWKSLSLDKNLLSQYASYEVSGAEYRPTHIFIQWFVDVDISQQVLVDENWTIDEKVASHLSSSAKPGENGNIIIYGHNKRESLGNIRALKGNEIITITTANGLEHRYKVEKIIEVNPSQTQYLEPTNEEVLTLYTCSGFMDKMRFIVRAKRVD